MQGDRVMYFDTPQLVGILILGVCALFLWLEGWR